jgi:hypothetical protein
MKKRTVRLLAALLVVICCLMLGAYSLADAGNFSGDTDWGGGGSDWGSSGSDWGSSSSSSDWGSGSTYYSDGSSGSSDGLGCLGGNMFAIVMFIIVVIVIIRYSKSGKNTAGSQVYQAAQETPGLPIETLKQKDPNFNEQAFLEKIGNWYIQMQNAWEAKKWEPMRAIMTDALYTQMERQLQSLVQAGRTNHVERIAVLDSRIVRYAPWKATTTCWSFGSRRASVTTRPTIERVRSSAAVRRVNCS